MSWDKWVAREAALKRKRVRRIFSVYVLFDGDRPFYVGQTSHSATRLSGHMCHARSGVGGVAGKAIRKRLEKGREPILHVIRGGMTYFEALECEREIKVLVRFAPQKDIPSRAEAIRRFTKAALRL